MLTPAELKQIRDYLALYGKKDTQLEPAKVPLLGREQISIVQDGVNKIAPFSEILETIGAGVKKDVCTYDWYVNHPDDIDTNTIYICTTEDGSQVIQIYLQGYPFMPTADAEFNFALSTYAVFNDVETPVTLSATASPVASDITFYDGSTVLATDSDCTTLTHIQNVTRSRTFTAKAHILGREFTLSRTIAGVYHVYFGAGTSSTASDASTTDSTPRNIPFNVTKTLGVADSTHYLYFEVPIGWIVEKVELVDNPSFPTEMSLHSTAITASHQDYVAYRNEELRAAGTHNYKIYIKSV